jgi:hypothetical protein
MAAADEHGARAEDERQAIKAPDTAGQAGEGFQCGDTVMSDQVTSGGERLVQATPCWDTHEELVSHHEDIAQREQRAANQERRAANALVEAENTACRGIAARDLERSPFAHRREIAEVIPERDGKLVRGVRVVFKPVPGLTAAWMTQAIGCQRARFERMGEPASYLPEDPSLIARATTEVELRDGHIEVSIESRDDVNATVALARAQDLVRPTTAEN